MTSLLFPILPVSPQLMCFAVAEATFILARSQDFILAIKKRTQRTGAENERIARGMIRSLVAELVVLVPLSSFVMLNTVRYLLPDKWVSMPGAYGILGFIAYAFPFISLKRAVTAWTLRSVKGFYDILSQAERSERESAEGMATLPTGDESV